jgi:hypothetical protein
VSVRLGASVGHVKLQPHHLLVVEQEATARRANRGIASASVAAAAATAASGTTGSGTCSSSGSSASSASSASSTSFSAAAPAEEVRNLLGHALDLVDDALGLLHYAAYLLDSAADALERRAGGFGLAALQRALGLVALELLVQLHERAQTPAARAGASGVTTRR